MRQRLLAVAALTFCLTLAGCADSTAETEESFAPSSEVQTEPEVAPALSQEAQVDDEVEGEHAKFQAALMAAIADYQSYAWDGEEILILNGEYHARIVGDYVVVKEAKETEDIWTSTLLNVNLPLEELLGQSDDRHFQSAIFFTSGSEARDYWLSPSGVHRYVRGEDVENWQFDGLTRETASLVEFGSFAPCVRTDSQLFNCAPNGEVELLIDGIINGHIISNHYSTIFAINDGELAEYSCGRSDDTVTVCPIAQNVASAVPLGIDFAVIFSCTDGNTYLVQNRDYETCYELLYGDPSIAYRYCLGQEPPEFYWEEYQTLSKIRFMNANGTESRYSDQEIVQQLLEKYCSSI